MEQLKNSNEALNFPKGYKQSEVGLIPEDWELNTLSYITKEMIQGVNTAIDIPDYVPYGIPMLKANNVIDGIVDLEKCDFVSIRTYMSYNERFKIKKDDFLFSNIGARLGTGTLYKFEKEATYAWNVMRIRPNKGLLFPMYFSHSINSSFFFKQIQSSQSGSGMGFVPKNILKDLKIPLPPTLDEQKAIAQVLSDTDALIQALEKKIAKKKLIKKGVMQELLTPKDGWVENMLGDETVVITKGTTPTSIGRQFTDTGINFIKVESLKTNGSFRSEMFAHIDSDTHSLLNRSQIFENDLLISIAGALGRSGIVSKEMLPANTNQALAIVRLKKESNIDLKFLFHYLRTEQIKTHIEAISSQGAQPNLSLQDIAEFNIQRPNITEQQNIAKVLSDMDSEIENLEQKLSKYQLAKQGLMQQLLTGKIRLV